jgi:predicted ATP-dependent endonuclease of OLD family
VELVRHEAHGDNVLRIKRISVEGLFGIFDHDIGMKLDDRITIIHGMNGYGKTTILRMVNALFNKRYSDLRTTPFKEFRVELEDDSCVVVNKLPSANGRKSQEAKRRRLSGISVKLLRGGKDVEKTEVNSTTPEEWQAQSHFPMPEHFIPGVVREGRNSWRYLPTNEEFAFEDLIDRFAEQMPAGVFKSVERPNMEWLHRLQKSVKVRFIESQRLLRLAKGTRHPNEYGEASPALELSVAVHASDLAKAIQGKLAEYATLSQALDRTFPGRLVEHMQSGSIYQTDSIAQLREKLNKLEEKRNRLQEAGLLDKQEDLRFQVPEELQEPTQRVLPVYVTDVEKKLGVFDDIAAKIDLLKDIVNSRFSYKNVSIDKEKGFVFRTDEGQPLNPSHLSSGEQHMLVLFSELLFRVESNSLVMIDVPEISLHVTWQKQFLRDLQGVTELASFDVLIATHSPQIVHDRWDELTVELKGASLGQGV